MRIISYDDLSCKHVRELHIHKINMNILIFQVFVILKLTLFYPCLIFDKNKMAVIIAYKSNCDNVSHDNIRELI